MTDAPADDELTPVGRFEWERVVQRVRLGRTTKLVALGLATHGNADGSSIRPGVERLAVDLESDERTIRRALDRLRQVGLVERVDSGASWGRRGWADVYRLTMPADLLSKVELLPLPTKEHRTAQSGDRRSERPKHRTAAPADPERNTGHQRPDHRTPVTEHRAAVTGTPDTSAHPPTMTTDYDHTTDHEADQYAGQYRPREAVS